MGYDVHITRAAEWTDSKSHPITLPEWFTYIRSDPEMRLEGIAQVALPSDDSLAYENPGLAVWTGWPHGGQDGNWAWFDLRDGRVVVKNPDDLIIAKMCAVAEKLGARVQGDDGEYYPKSTAPVDPETPPLQQPPGMPWWRRIFHR
jgi:hypothetical protein